jgi:two-component system, NarL family, nitrate/nitrite response regulator NarL
MRQSTATTLVDRCTLFREGLARILSGSHFRIVQKLSSLGDLTDNVADGQTSLFMIGLTADGAHDETLELRAIRQKYPTAHVVVLSEAMEAVSLATALQSGVDGYLLKTMSCEALIKSLDLVMLGEFVIPGAAMPLLRQLGTTPVEPPELVGLMPVRPHELPAVDSAARLLSSREAQILSCIREGGSNKLIARKFDITEATVKVHVKAILRKLRAKNRTQAAIWANNYMAREQSDWPPADSSLRER